MSIEIDDYYPFKSSGKIIYDPKRGKVCDPFWAIVVCDEGIIDYYRWHLLRWGIESERGSLWGSHISFVKGERPKDISLWKKYDGLKIEFSLSNNIRFDNGIHIWLDIYSPQLHDIRKELGLKDLSSMSLHLTLGRLKYPGPNIKYVSRYRPYLQDKKIFNI